MFTSTPAKCNRPAAARPLELSRGAGCAATLRWPNPGRVEIEIRSPSGRVARRVRGPWTAAALRQADSEIRSIADQALRSHQAPPLADAAPEDP